jgi:pimeloyl-ACP methyl ester carboxylesterase
MPEEINRQRRDVLTLAAASIGATTLAAISTPHGQSQARSPPAGLGPLRPVEAGELHIAYHESGPADGPVAILLHGFPYDVSSYGEVAPMLAARGCRVIVPHLRGHGLTRFVNDAIPRSGQQAAIGADLIALIDALKIPRAVVAGYDWGGRAACVAAALWPHRCAGLVSVNGYLIQDIANAAKPLPAQVEAGLWYQFYFQTERGRAGLVANRRDIARILWMRNSPTWKFDDATFDRSATAFDNPDYVEVVVHSYRHRLGGAAGTLQFEALERRLAELPVITVPTITLDGESDGVVPATDGTSTAAKFAGPRIHRVVPHVGHNLPQEAPEVFANAVSELVQRA